MPLAHSPTLQGLCRLCKTRARILPPVSPSVISFHRSLPGYAPTPIVNLPTLAKSLDVGRIVAKDESRRLSLPAFKILGVSWAARKALETVEPGDEVTLVTATDGNHGRAVARTARLLGHSAIIVVPASGIHPTAVKAIQDEGATVETSSGSYDDACLRAMALSKEGKGRLLLQDTSWPRYEDVPRYIVEGYTTLFSELDAQLGSPPDLVIVQAGVGSLAQAAVTHYRSSQSGTRVVTVEPTRAGCVFASIRAGRSVTVPTSDTCMSGLNCGTPSYLAWPVLFRGLDGAIMVSEEQARDAEAPLKAANVSSGPCGWAGIAGAKLLLSGADTRDIREKLSITADSVVVTIVTEGRERCTKIPPLEG
ncbi:tryptophan synthase beta subunit-like PLP-dependent enzyme [Gonapodya prolifera JEL478]|uniref:Tryptophan synthase beta subunit-like PLP-dependent enzyme n=1 Tax=Gonapodya prolifera (strain JEL478) TaxID=1344416 RepID=A0A139ANJ5_GONPJ|nr:tryptophan synthase beta subunit-like PLP-dependent enzyme [Gonapodya prolifera JEL478]|eukprot:KXS18093.1 tryptophan synthase beta subunit-like PLP-dependent enzyme [Gonapodya prolifera JEL478]